MDLSACINGLSLKRIKNFVLPSQTFLKYTPQKYANDIYDPEEFELAESFIKINA